MRVMKHVAVVGMVLFLARGAFAQMDKVAKLDITAIKTMRFEERGADLMAKTGLVFSNAADSEIKLRNGEFRISVKSVDRAAADRNAPPKTTPIGTGKLEELVFPAASRVEGGASKPGQLLKEMEIKVGPRDDKTTMQRLIALFNIVGDPASTFTLILEGTCEVGIKAEKGWIYQSGITVELEFQPSIQREVLFK